MLAKDNSFLAYLGRGGSKNDTASTKMYTRDNFNKGVSGMKKIEVCLLVIVKYFHKLIKIK